MDRRQPRVWDPPVEGGPRHAQTQGLGGQSTVPTAASKLTGWAGLGRAGPGQGSDGADRSIPIDWLGWAGPGGAWAGQGGLGRARRGRAKLGGAGLWRAGPGRASAGVVSGWVGLGWAALNSVELVWAPPGRLGPRTDSGQSQDLG